VQASRIYTTKIFDQFQEEYEEYQGAFIKYPNECHSACEYTVEIFGDTQCTVTANLLDDCLSSDCQKFDTFGILCSHALKVLDVMDVKLIPYKYILKRWMKNACNGRVQDLHGLTIQINSKSKFTH